jgi:putative transcriptional regulator
MNDGLPTYRDRPDLSEAEIAETVGVSRQTIDAIERERYDPSLALAFALATFFDSCIEDSCSPS